MSKHDAAAELQAAGIAAAPVNSGEELLTDPHLYQRGWWNTVDLPGGGEEQQRGWVVQFSKGGPSHVKKRAPHIGEDTREVLLGLGYSEDDIDALHARSIVSSPQRVPVES
jgi:crotonobetainyl-CoA:carnitine CoA-transferase CaiB-like acyl-CoA transferase